MVSFPLVLFPYVSPPLRARLSPLPFGAGTFARVLTCTGYGRLHHVRGHLLRGGTTWTLRLARDLQGSVLGIDSWLCMVNTRRVA